MTFPDGTHALVGDVVRRASRRVRHRRRPVRLREVDAAADRLRTHPADDRLGHRRTAREIGYVFQDATLLQWRTVMRNVELFAELEGVPKAETRQTGRREHRARRPRRGHEKKYPKQLSGGMKMRASLARSRSCSTPRCSCSTNRSARVDEITRERLNDEVIALFQRKRFAGLFITHSISEAVFLSTQGARDVARRPGRIVGEFDVPVRLPAVARSALRRRVRANSAARSPTPSEERTHEHRGRSTVRIVAEQHRQRRAHGRSRRRTRRRPPTQRRDQAVGTPTTRNSAARSSARSSSSCCSSRSGSTSIATACAASSTSPASCSRPSPPCRRPGVPRLRRPSAATSPASRWTTFAAVIGLSITHRARHRDSQWSWPRPGGSNARCTRTSSRSRPCRCWPSCPLINSVFGGGIGARIFVCVMISIFPIVTNTLFGLTSVDTSQHDLFTLRGASRRTRLSKLQFPAAMPAIFTGFRIAAGLSVIGAIVGEQFFRRGRSRHRRRRSNCSARSHASRQLYGALIVAVAARHHRVLLLRRASASSSSAMWHESTQPSG